MITNADKIMIRELFERVENDEISSEDALYRLNEYVAAQVEDAQNKSKES